jgi:hypothetical protein
MKSLGYGPFILPNINGHYYATIIEGELITFNINFNEEIGKNNDYKR